MSKMNAEKSRKTLIAKLNSDFFLYNAIYFILLFILIIISLIDPTFFSIKNASAILTQTATRIIFALGAAGVIILGGTDLSVGRQVGLSAVISCSLLQEVGYARRVFSDMDPIPVFIPILLVMLICGIISLAHGYIVAKWNVAPFIASLGVQLVVYGLCSIYFNNIAGSAPISGLDLRFKKLVVSNIKILGTQFNILLLYAAVVGILIWILWNKTKLGKNMYAIGGNKEAAKVCGVNVSYNMILIYILAGLLYGFGGALEGARTGSATNALGVSYELDAIAACVVGGVSMRGGTGTVQGVVIGVTIFQVINYGLIYIGVSPDVQYLVKGLIIIFAVAIDTRKHLRRS